MSVIDKIQLPNGEIYDIGGSGAGEVEALTSVEIDELTEFTSSDWESIISSSELGGITLVWGNITGALSNQTDLQAALNNAGVEVIRL